ncbi:hypothetical protein P8Q88_06600 [Qipengyuania sp. XHP0207]|uniref:hypothetical protein n=1 Tax=Qipengyuania sp. XHP0207 TaxID=3038078 RepID=UPI00241D1202|nr:hypothetical protein [Qipengyuania sp. XHP0207]MDG5747845.1 hypothetical protein [Qipengyuania sp. XHP0207]
MSALTLAALGLAQRGAQALPALFGDLAMRTPSPDICRLDTAGFSRPGHGNASYVSDDLADEALALAHPRFVVQTRNGRLFRLLPEAGSLSVEQGGATGDGVTNDQPAIQAAIEYAEAIGAGEVRFESARYRIDCPLRTSPVQETRATDGHPLVVSKSSRLRGCAPERSVLDFRGPDGVDPDANWQTVATSSADASPAVWRGGGLFIDGDAARPEPAPRRIARLELDRLVFAGNRKRTAQTSFPADPATGDGWDISDKGFWLQDVYVGTVICRDTDFIGWRGEIFYAVGADDAIEQLSLTRCRLLTGNGNGLNLGCDPRVDAEDCEFGDCKIAQEDTGKSYAHFRNCLWRDCEYVWLGGGSTHGRLYSYKYPTRDPLAPVPATILAGCRFDDAGLVWVNSWVSGRIRTVDTPVAISSTHGHALRDIDLEIDALLDRRPGFNAVGLFGPNSLTQQVEGAPAGVYHSPPTQIRLKVRHHRSALAQQAGRHWLDVRWGGYLDRSCRIDVEGEFLAGRVPNGADDPLSFPLVIFNGGNATSASTAQGYYRPAAIGVSGELAPASSHMALALTGDIALDLTLPANPRGGAPYGYADGQRLRLVKQDAAGSITFVKGASPSTAMMITRVLDKPHDWIEFTYNRAASRWEEAGFGAY